MVALEAGYLRMRVGMRAGSGLAHLDFGHFALVLPGDTPPSILGLVIERIEQAAFHVAAALQRMVEVPFYGPLHRCKAADDVAITQLMLELEEIDHPMMVRE